MTTLPPESSDPLFHDDEAAALHVVMVSDDPQRSDELLMQLLSSDYAVDYDRASDAASLAGKLDPIPDIILCSDTGPTGMRPVLDLLAHRRLDVPVIVISSRKAARHAVEAMRQGIADYLLRDELERLMPAVTRAHAEHLRRQSALEEQRRVDERKTAAQRLEASGRVAAGIAHDFNNVLTVIATHGRFIEDRLPADDPARDDLDAIREASERAGSLVSQLLAFSRRQVQQAEVLDLRQVVRDLDGMLRSLLGDRIVMVVQMAPDLELVRADAAQVEQILMNLGANARDAMPEGGTLSITALNDAISLHGEATRVSVTPGRYVRLTIEDTGVGMNEATRLRIFEPFFSTKGRRPGLGLSTVHGIVHQSGGHITVNSEVDQGTRFDILLPALDAAPQPQPSHAPRGTSSSGQERLLVVEDDPMVRRATRRALERGGYPVVEALDPEQALDLGSQAEEPIDLLITDVVMPGLSGRELAKRLRHRRPDLRVLFMSGYTDVTVTEAGSVEAGTPFLRKPFSPAQLLRAVRKALDQ